MTSSANKDLALRQHLKQACLLVRHNPLLLLTIFAVGAIGEAGTLLRTTDSLTAVDTVFVVLSMLITPVLYGICTRLLDGTVVTIKSVIATYLLPYYWLLLRMYLPAVIVVSAPIVLGGEQDSGGYLEVGLILFSMLYLYVIPYFFHSGRQAGAVRYGIVFLFRNLSASTPLLLTVLLLEAAVLLSQRIQSVSATHPLMGASIDFMIFIGSTLADLVIFIVLLLVIRDAQQAPFSEN